MKKTGTLQYGPGEARVGGELIAIIDGEPNPLAAAKGFLVARGFQAAQRITVIGNEGELGTTTVIFMIDAQPAEGTFAVTAAVAAVAPDTKSTRPEKKPRRKPEAKSRSKAKQKPTPKPKPKPKRRPKHK